MKTKNLKYSDLWIYFENHSVIHRQFNKENVDLDLLNYPLISYIDHFFFDNNYTNADLRFDLLTKDNETLLVVKPKTKKIKYIYYNGFTTSSPYEDKEKHFRLLTLLAYHWICNYFSYLKNEKGEFVVKVVSDILDRTVKYFKTQEDNEDVVKFFYEIIPLLSSHPYKK